MIAATNRDLEALLRTGSFRRDLFERLDAVEIVVPPLRERRDEILPLTEFFLTRYGQTLRPSAQSAVRRCPPAPAVV